MTMATKNTKLRACPFCYRKDAYVRKIIPTQAPAVHFVQCACGARAGGYATRRAAIAAWNGVMFKKEGEVAK